MRGIYLKGVQIGTYPQSRQMALTCFRANTSRNKLQKANLFFNKWAIPGLFFVYFRLFNTVASTQMFHIKVCRWLDSNRGPLVSEATALPTEPQPNLIIFLPFLFFSSKWMKRLNGWIFFKKHFWQLMQLSLQTNFFNTAISKCGYFFVKQFIQFINGTQIDTENKSLHTCNKC